MDGSEINAWRGTDKGQKIDAIMCNGDLTKKDSEIKILIGCTEEEKRKIYHIHNHSANIKGILIRRL